MDGNLVQTGYRLPRWLVDRIKGEAQRQALGDAAYVRMVLARHFEALDLEQPQQRQA